MGQRITSRDRPRLSAYPWPLRTKRVTTAEINDGALDGSLEQYLLGPLTLPAVMEVLYRVSEFSYSGTLAVDIEYEDHTDNFSVAASGALTAVSTPSEIGHSTNHRYKFDGDDVESNRWENTGSLIGNWFQPLFTPVSLFPPPFEVYHNYELDQYWLRGTAAIEFNDGIVYFYGVGTIPFGGGGYDQRVDVPLVLSDSTHTLRLNIPLSANETFVSCSLEITASAWLPYATKAGADAWGTADGLAANGGPLG